MNFEIKAKDIAARIGKFGVSGKVIETPAIMPVYNPNKPLIGIEELKNEFGVEILMTNAYVILKNDALRQEVLDKGIHRFLNFDGIIATDSGSYQLMRYGSVLTTNPEILEFQEMIGSDIGSFLDIPSLPDAYKPRAEEQLEVTLKRAKQAKSINPRFTVNAGIQGAKYIDLREKAAKEMGGDFKLIAIGGIVKLMEDYRFSELVDIIAAVKKNIPANRAVHAFGLGHPMIFSLAAGLGCDLFDSAAYALYARQGRYLTAHGTKKVSELSYLPCSCPVCSNHDVSDLTAEELLARHNLYATFEELNRVKEAIKEGNLWELIQMRARAHPHLLSALERMVKHKGWLAEFDPVTKNSAFFYGGSESLHRSEVVNADNRLKRVSSDNLIQVYPFGAIPAEIADIYPFGSAMVPERFAGQTYEMKIRDLQKIRRIMDYQFGAGAGGLIDDDVKIKRSRKTRRIRWVYKGRDLIASVRAKDHFILPKMPLAEKLHDLFEYPKLRVVVDDEAVQFIKEGKSVFAKFVKEIDPGLRAGDEVLVVDENDSLLRVGTLFLSPREVMDFDRGMAARVR